MTHVRGRTTSSADRVREFRARHQVGPRVEVRSAFGGKADMPFCTAHVCF
jgi:hypothetical protein